MAHRQIVMLRNAAVVREYFAQRNRKGNAVIAKNGLLKLPEALSQLFQFPRFAAGDKDEMPAFHIRRFAGTAKAQQLLADIANGKV
ncbi:hypothetical protein D3C85_1774330 [compost metagenome]